MADVKFVRTTKQKQIDRGTYDINALYFTKDSHEMYRAEKLLTDGLRYVENFSKLPSFDTAADGKIYFVLSTGKGYVINPERNQWLIVIYTATNNIDTVEEIEAHETVLTVAAAKQLESQLKEYIREQKPTGVISTGDGKTIEVAEDGKVSIYGSGEAEGLTLARMNQGKTHVEWVPASEVVDNYTVSRLDDTTSEGIIGHYYLDKNGEHVTGSDFKIPDFVTMDIDENGDKEHNSVKCYTFRQGDKLIGHIDIPTDLVVQSGSVIVATNEDKALDEAVIVGETYLKLVIAHQEKPIYILTKDLFDTDFDVVDNGTGKFVTDVTYANNKFTITRSDVAWDNVTEKPSLVNSVKATGDTEITMAPSTEASGKVEITAAHTTHAAGSANTPSTEKVEGYSAIGTIKIPKIITNAAGHVTEISEETVTIKMPPKEEAGAGENGATFTPSMSTEGVLSWTNDKGLPNPDPVNIKGPQGEPGKTPVKGEDYMTEADIAEIVERTLNALPAAEEVKL